MDSRYCKEATYCNDSYLLQKRVYEMQNPSEEECKKAKFLVFGPYNIGIGAMFHLAADAMTIAINTGRILYFRSHLQKGPLWSPDGCHKESMQCYFQPMTSCSLDESNMNKYPVWEQRECDFDRNNFIYRSL